PVRVVRNGRFDYTRLIVWIDIEKRRADQALEIIDHNFLLLRIKQVETAQQNSVDRCGLPFRVRSGRGRTSRGGRPPNLPGAFFPHPNRFAPREWNQLRDPNIFLRQTRIEIFDNLDPKKAIADRGSEGTGNPV